MENNLPNHVKDESMDWEPVDDKLKRKIMGYDEKIMMVKVHFQKGGVGTMHKHYHSQTTYVVSGVFDVTIDGKTVTLKGGDVFYVPTNAEHGAVCQEEGMLIDVFSPHREDFLSS